MFEKYHCHFLESLLTKRNVSVILNEIVHESAEIKLICKNLLVYDFETIDVYVALR